MSASIQQGISSTFLALNPNARFTLVYRREVSQTARNGYVTNKYALSKKIYLKKKKYTYN